MKRKSNFIAMICFAFALLVSLFLTFWYRAGIFRVKILDYQEFSVSPYSVLFSLDQKEYQENGSCLITARAIAEDAVFPFENYASAETGESMFLSAQLGILQGEKVYIFPSRSFVPQASEKPDEIEQRIEEILNKVEWIQQNRKIIASYGLQTFIPDRFADHTSPLVLVLFFPEGSYLVPLEETV